MSPEAHLPAPPKPPRIPARLEPCNCTTEGESSVELIAFDAGDELAGIERRDITCDRCSFAQASLAGASVEGATVTDVDCFGSDVSNLRARGGSFERVLMRDTRAVGISLLEARLRDVEFVESNLDLARCRFAQLERVAFRGCRLRDADFSNAKLASVTFEGCDLTKVDFTKAVFARCEIRSCVIEGVRGLVNLEGIAMPFPDLIELAPSLARALGLHVLDS